MSVEGWGQFQTTTKKCGLSYTDSFSRALQAIGPFS
jgi:hypothetical protein